VDARTAQDASRLIHGCPCDKCKSGEKKFAAPVPPYVTSKFGATVYSTIRNVKYTGLEVSVSFVRSNRTLND